MRWNQLARAVITGAVGLLPLTVVADEVEVDVKDVPAPVREAAEKTAPKAKWRKATKETGEEETTFNLNGADEKGREINITLTAEGEVETFETVLSVTDLPNNIIDVLRTLPQVKWTEATVKVEDGKTTYEVNGNDLNDRGSNAIFNSDGQATISTDRELSEVPAVVLDALRTKLPTFQSQQVRSITENGKLISYLFMRSEDTDGEKSEVTVSADGKTVTVGDEEDD